MNEGEPEFVDEKLKENLELCKKLEKKMEELDQQLEEMGAYNQGFNFDNPAGEDDDFGDLSFDYEPED